MKTTITVTSIHTGVKTKLTFDDEAKKHHWVVTNGHNYVLNAFSIKKS